MADQYNDILIEVRKIFSVDPVLIPLLGMIGETLVDGISTLDNTTITVDDTTGFPDSGVVILTSDNTSVTYTGITATTFTGCGSHRATVNDESAGLLSVRKNPRPDLADYTDDETPSIAFSITGDDGDEFPTIGEFDGRYTIYLEIIDIGQDLDTVTEVAQRVLAEVRRIVREETNDTTPLNGKADHVVWLGSEQGAGRASNDRLGVSFQCTIGVLDVSTS